MATLEAPRRETSSTLLLVCALLWPFQHGWSPLIIKAGRRLAKMHLSSTAFVNLADDWRSLQNTRGPEGEAPGSDHTMGGAARKCLIVVICAELSEAVAACSVRSRY